MEHFHKTANSSGLISHVQFISHIVKEHPLFYRSSHINIKATKSQISPEFRAVSCLTSEMSVGLQQYMLTKQSHMYTKEHTQGWLDSGKTFYILNKIKTTFPCVLLIGAPSSGKSERPE